MTTPSFSVYDYATMAVYLLLVVGIGIYFSRKKEESTEDYLLGGRKMPSWAVGISYYVSLLSTLSLVAVPGEAFNHGVSMIIGSLIIPLASILSFFIFVRFYFRAKTFTPYSYLESRFDIKVRTLAAFLFWIMRIMYLAVVLYSCAKIFEGASGWSAELTIVLVGSVGIVYTIIGGIKAVIWTDVTQFAILVGGLIIVLITCVQSVPENIFGIIKYSFEHERGFEYFKDPRFYTLSPFIRLNLWIMIISTISMEMFNNSCDQLSIQRLLTTSSYAQAKKSLFTYALIVLPAGIVLYLVGLAIFVFYAHYPVANGEITGDTALFRFISTQLKPPLPGLIISAMLAAVMSTLDSGMNSLATVATKDFYLRFFNRNASEKKQIRFSQWITLLVGVLAVCMGLVIASANTRIGQSMIEVASLWFAFFNVLWPIFFLGVTSHRVHGGHIMICIAVSWAITASMVIWYLVSKGTSQELSFTWIGMPGMFSMFILGYCFALFSKPVNSSKTEGLTLWTIGKTRTNVKKES